MEKSRLYAKLDPLLAASVRQQMSWLALRRVALGTQNVYSVAIQQPFFQLCNNN